MDFYIKPVNVENWREVISLSVNENQKSFIEDNAFSIAESKFYTYWNPSALYYGEELIGFAMYGHVPQENRVWLDRFMIDKSCQGKGYGKGVLTCLINHIFNKYKCNEIYLSIFEENKFALKLYKDFGFYVNGEIDYGGEKVMVLNIEK